MLIQTSRTTESSGEQSSQAARAWSRDPGVDVRTCVGGGRLKTFNSVFSDRAGIGVGSRPVGGISCGTEKGMFQLNGVLERQRETKPRLADHWNTGEEWNV